MDVVHRWHSSLIQGGSELRRREAILGPRRRPGTSNTNFSNFRHDVIKNPAVLWSQTIGVARFVGIPQLRKERIKYLQTATHGKILVVVDTSSYWRIELKLLAPLTQDAGKCNEIMAPDAIVLCERLFYDRNPPRVTDGHSLVDQCCLEKHFDGSVPQRRRGEPEVETSVLE